MSNYNYFTIYVIALIICVIVEYLPTDNLVFLLLQNDVQIIDLNLDRIFKRHGIEIVYRIESLIGKCKINYI